MERLGGEVRRELGRFGPAAGMADVVAVWPGVVGEAIARNAWPARIGRDGTLHVAVSSSAWAFELTHLEATVLARLRETLPEPPARLRFTPGRLPEPSVPAAEPGPRGRPEPRPEDVEEAARIAAGIEDEELRSIVARAAAASLARAASGRPF